MLMDKQKLLDLLTVLKPKLETANVPLIRSAYGNYYKIGGEQIEDVKNPKNYYGATYISTDQRTFKTDLGKYIRMNV
jgi:hypothetical protein